MKLSVFGIRENGKSVKAYNLTGVWERLVFRNPDKPFWELVEQMKRTYVLHGIVWARTKEQAEDLYFKLKKCGHWFTQTG